MIRLLCFGLAILVPLVLFVVLPVYWLFRKNRIKLGGVLVVIAGVALYLATLKVVLSWQWAP
jgi:hypothetical protein